MVDRQAVGWFDKRAIAPLALLCISALPFVTGVTTEITGWRELAQFVAHHIFGDENRNECFAIVYGNGFSHHIGDNQRRTAPRFDNLFAGALF